MTLYYLSSDKYSTLQQKGAIYDKLEQENISLKESYTHFKVILAYLNEILFIGP